MTIFLMIKGVRKMVKNSPDKDRKELVGYMEKKMREKEDIRKKSEELYRKFQERKELYGKRS